MGQCQESYGNLLLPVVLEKVSGEICRQIARENSVNNWELGGVSMPEGVLTLTLQSVCNWFATRKKLKSRCSCKGRGKVFLKSPTSRRLKSVASCLLNMHKRLAATEFDREEVA